jgi:hypothetical protein
MMVCLSIEHNLDPGGERRVDIDSRDVHRGDCSPEAGCCI